MRFLALVLESEEPSESFLTSRVAKLPLKELRTLLTMEELVLTVPVQVPMTKLVKILMEKTSSTDVLNTVLLYP